jgi:hypothetical protein
MQNWHDRAGGNRKFLGKIGFWLDVLARKAGAQKRSVSIVVGAEERVRLRRQESDLGGADADFARHGVDLDATAAVAHAGA